jgi:predicted GH43/DUF377 family glycosyl hydrolase
MSHRTISWGSLVLTLALLSALLLGIDRHSSTSTHEHAAAASPAGFPADLVAWTPAVDHPVFSGAGQGHWDAMIRERGWILREGDTFHLWYTGYDGAREGMKQLGYATSPDGLHWTRWPENPIVRDHWVEDMMVVKHGHTYYMFAEGALDQAQLLTSTDRVHWKLEGKLDVRRVDGQPISPGPYGTPVAWHEAGVWYLLYERSDAGIWLATSTDLKVWTNRQDQPVFVPGPEPYDRAMIAFDQIIQRGAWYYAIYHATGDTAAPRTWNTGLARSRDLLHWEKYPGNPLLNDRSSGVTVFDGRRLRLYTMHSRVDVYDSGRP